MTQGGVAPQARRCRSAEIGNAAADVRRYHWCVQVDPQQEIEAREIELLTARVRAGLVVWLGAAIVFVASDLVLGLAQPAVVHLTRLSNLAAIAGYLYLRRPRQRWQIEAAAVSVMLVGIAVLSLCVAVLPDSAAALILLSVMVLGSATVLPWSFRCQVTVAVAAAVGMVCAAIWVSAEVRQSLSNPLLGVFISFGASIYIAKILEEQRNATNRAFATAQADARVSSALARVGRELIESLDEPALLRRLCSLTREVMGCAASYTFLVGEDGSVTAVAGDGCTDDEWEAMRRANVPSSSLAPLLAQLRNSGFAHVDLSDASCEMIVGRVHPGDSLTLGIYFALRKGEELVGFQAAAFRRTHRAPTLYEGRLARGLSDLASLALQNARLLKELENANRVQGDFLANMSHELRTPLNVIMGYCEMLEDGAFGEVNEEQKATIRHLSGAAEGQLALISATLQLSGLDSGDVPLETYDVDMTVFLEELERETGMVVRARGLDFVWQSQAEGVTLRTDAVKLKMILKNLVDNAVKFTDSGHVALRVQPVGDGLRFAVEDTGPGIPDTAKEAIFEAFRQDNRPQTQGRGGVGIGLYIVRRLAEALGGTVDLHSQLGAGTTFEVWVPGVRPDGLRHSA